MYNYWTRPKNLFASNILQLNSVEGFLGQAQEDATLLAFSTKFTSKPPALLALTFRKLRNFFPALPKFVVVDLESFSHTPIHDVMRFGSTFRSFLVTRTLFTKKLVGLPLSQDPHKIFVRQSLCLGQSFATQTFLEDQSERPRHVSGACSKVREKQKWKQTVSTLSPASSEQMQLLLAAI